jgi:glycosyltransferase involved in cell wall biosynthesis
VIVSDQVYLHPRVTAGAVGTVTRLDAGAVAEELRRWLDHPAVRNDAAGRAREFALSQFSWDEVARNWVGHYARLVTPAAPLFPNNPSP